MPFTPAFRYLRAALFTGALAVISCTSAPIDEPALPRLQLVEDLRLDADAEDFSAFNRVVVNHDGRMAVPLGQDMHIRIYDSTGHRLMALGRRGSGPGEFQHLGPLTWLADTLFVGDERQMRVTYFGAEGETIRTRVLPPPLAPTSMGDASGGMFRVFRARSGLPNGTILGDAQLAIDNTAVWQWHMIALSSDGSSRLVAKPPQLNDERWHITVDGLGKNVPFALRPQFAYSADGSRFGFLTADQGRRDGSFRITVLRASGDTLFERDYPVIGEPIPSTAIDSAIGAMVPQAGQPTEDGGPPIGRFQDEARRRMPMIYPPAEELMLALDGTVWVTLRATSAGREALVLDSLGTPIATVQLPPRSRVQQATARHLWATETDDDGLTSVVRSRIGRQ